MRISYTAIRPWLLMTFAALIGAIVFGITQISYWLVEANAPAEHVPIGLASLAMDIFSYYSFIWQAADGHWFFTNAMTSEPCDRVFFNLQWLVLGRCMAWFGWSSLFAFTLWRFVGAIALFMGFALLVLQVLPRTSQRIVALLMCAFGGGFGWFIAMLGDLGVVDTSDTFGLKNPAMDLITPIHPFGQILKNPHYSLPHGTFLFFVAAYIQGERTRKTRWYILAAAVAFIHGLIRPYDVITICAVVPAYIFVDVVRNRSLGASALLTRAMPLFACLPLLAYFYYIFSIHPVFKWWAIQGKQLPTPATWHTLGLGLAALLFLYRLIQYKKFSSTDPGIRFLAVLALTILALYHANHLSDAFAFSPQIGIPIMAPLILVGLGALPYIQDRWFRNKRVLWTSVLCMFVAVNSLSSPFFVVWTARIGQDTPRNYTCRTDVEAMEWLKEHARDTDLILSNDVMGGRLSFTVGARVALGHWALTPHVQSLKKRFSRLASGELPNRKAKNFIAEIAPRYLYISSTARYKRSRAFWRNAGLQLVYTNEDVAIYERRPMLAFAH